MSTKIMIGFHKKHANPTKKDLDNEIAQLFNNASDAVSKLAGEGKKPCYDLDFWHNPKLGTIFENVSNNSTYRFAAKALEARDRWVDRQRDGQGPSEGASKYECEAAKAVDRFNDAINIADLTSGGLAALMNGVFPGSVGFSMKSYVVDQFSEDDDTSDDEVSGADEGLAHSTTANPASLERADSALVVDKAALALADDSSADKDNVQDDDMTDEADYCSILAQLAMEDAAQLDDDIMDFDGY